MSQADQARLAAARAALDRLPEDGVVGLGSGRAVNAVIEREEPMGAEQRRGTLEIGSEEIAGRIVDRMPDGVARALVRREVGGERRQFAKRLRPGSPVDEFGAHVA